MSTVFITGADRGLGFALTEELIKRGWTVFAGQYMPQWPELACLKSNHSAALRLVPLDVASIESAREAARLVAEQTDSLDMLINNAGIIAQDNETPVRQPQDYAAMTRMFEVNALGPLRSVEAFLPLLDKGTTKRLCFVSSEAGSIGASKRIAWYGYCMSKAAVNMAIRNLFNYLREDGYTFRVYHPGWMRSYMSGTKNDKADLEPAEAAVYALKYFLSGIDPSLPAPDEDRLALRDYLGREYPW